MPILDLHGDDMLSAAVAAPPTPPKRQDPKFSTWGLLTAPAKGVRAGVAEGLATTAEILGAFGQVSATTGASAGGMFSTGTDTERAEADKQARRIATEGVDYRSEGGVSFRNVAKDFMPDPLSAHAAEVAVSDFARVATKAVAAGVTLGTLAGAVVAGTEEGFTASEKLAQQGVDKETRSKVGAVTGAVTALGFALPVAGKTIAGTVGLAAVGGPVSFVAQQAATREILQGADYSQLADQYDPFDPVGLTLSTLIPAGFGAAAMRGAARAARVEAATVEAARVSLLREQVQAAKPADTMQADAPHEAAYSKAMDQMAAGERVDVLDVAQRELSPKVREFADQIDAELIREVGVPIRALPESVRQDLGTAVMTRDAYTKDSPYMDGWEANGRDIDEFTDQKVTEALEQIDDLRLRVDRLSPNDIDDTGRRVSDKVVNQYREMLTEGEAPPILVRQRKGGGYSIIEGGHRLQAAKRAGASEIQAVDITDLLDMPPKKLFEQRADVAPARSNAQPPDIATAPGRDGQALTERGESVPIRWGVVEADALVTSHDNTLAKNPRYPQALQPRDRSRAASEQQIAGIENAIKPELLGDSPKASDGAPIIGRDGVVESGNARTIALRRAYESGKAEDYRAWVAQNAERFGVNPTELANLRKPVLVRVGQGEYNRAEFARQANESPVAAMSQTEIATTDAARLPELDGMRVNDDGSINLSQSGDFVRSFVRDAVSPSERGAFMTASGEVSQQGLQRMRNAVFAKAYGDTDLVAMMTESTDANVKNVLAGMMRAAPGVARLRGMMEAGARETADIAGPLVQAVRKFSQLRADGVTVDQFLAQSSMFDNGLPPEVVSLLQALQSDARAPRRVADMINRLADTVDAMGDPRQSGMFGDAPKGAEVVGKAAERSAMEAQAARIEAEQPDMLVQLDGMDAPRPLSEVMAMVRDEAARDMEVGPLVQVAAECAITVL